MIVAWVISFVFHLFVNGTALSNTVDFTIGFLPAYFSWMAFAGFVIYYPMRDVFGESPFLVRLGVLPRGFCYLLIIFLVPICPIAIIFGLGFLKNFSFDEFTLPQRFSNAFIPSLFGWSAIILMQKYSDNFTVDHPVQQVDLNQGKKGGRKGLSKNQKPSESGIRCCKRLGVIIGAVIVGYLAAHWIVVPMHICGHLLAKDIPPFNPLTVLDTSSLTDLVEDFPYYFFPYVETPAQAKEFAKHHVSPFFNDVLWGGAAAEGDGQLAPALYGFGGEAGVAMTVAILLAAHGIYTMAYGVQVPKSGQSLSTTNKRVSYDEEVEPTDGNEDEDDDEDEDGSGEKKKAKAEEEKTKQDPKRLKAQSAYGSVKKK